MVANVKLSPAERDFYTREYDRIGAELVENESMGEGRVALYLGVWSAAVGGVGAIVSVAGSLSHALVSVALVGLAVVLALGLVTAIRILKRNHHTDELIDALMRLRHLLRPLDSELIVAAFPWEDDKVLTKECRHAVLHAGLLQVVCLANAVVPALGLVALWRDAAAPAYVGATVVAALILQLSCVFAANRAAWSKRQQKGERFSASLRRGAEAPTMTPGARDAVLVTETA